MFFQIVGDIDSNDVISKSSHLKSLFLLVKKSVLGYIDAHDIVSKSVQLAECWSVEKT